MNAIHELEKLGYRFTLAIDYTGPPGSHAAQFLQELAANRDEAILALAERPFHPEHIRTSEQYRTAIIKGMNVNADLRGTFLQAAKCISIMTGDSHFYTLVKEGVGKRYA